MFLINKINFEDPNLSKKTLFANYLGNLFLSPVRYLFNGKSVTCCFLPVEKFCYPHPLADTYHGRPKFGDLSNSCPQDGKNMFITMVAILAFIPFTILGAAIKGTAMLLSGRLRKREKSFQEYLTLPLKAKLIQEIQIAIFKADSTMVSKTMNKLSTREEKLDFMETYCTSENSGVYQKKSNAYRRILRDDFLGLIDNNLPIKL